MIRRCACMIAAMASFSLSEASGQEPGFQGNVTDAGQHPPSAGKNPDLREIPAGGNPLWGIPLSALSATRERPIFAASRRPPAPPAPPMPVAEAPPPPPPAAPEQPPFTLVGTAISKPQSVALVLDQTSKNLVRLHVGEAAAGWYLRSVDLRTMTLEKDSQFVTLSLPVPGSVAAGQPAGQPALALAGGASREF